MRRLANGGSLEPFAIARFFLVCGQYALFCCEEWVFLEVWGMGMGIGMMYVVWITLFSLVLLLVLYLCVWSSKCG